MAGATGDLGARTVSALERNGHEAIPISRSHGVDLITGQGLDAALEGVDAVVDAISSPPISPDETRRLPRPLPRDIFSPPRSAPACVTTYCCRCVGIHRIEGGTAHYSGKRQQERLIEEGRVPWTIVPATQFQRLCGVGC